MSNPQHIHLALKALAPSGPVFHDDEAPGDAVAPWLVGSLKMPEPITNLAARTSAGTGMWRVTVAAETGAQARVLAAQAETAWSSARVDVDGYVLGSVRPPRVRGPYAAGRTATDTDLQFQVVVMEFDLTFSATP